MLTANLAARACVPEHRPIRHQDGACIGFDQLDDPNTHAIADYADVVVMPMWASIPRTMRLAVRPQVGIIQT
jgi:hypothetical protein